MNKNEIEIIVTNPLLKELNGIPKFKTEGSGAMDLVACVEKEIVLQPQEQLKLDLGFRIYIKNPGLAGVVMPRSSTGTLGLVCANTVGFIDSDYQGPLMCVLWNRLMPTISYNDEILFRGGNPITIKPGDRIGQIAFVRVEQARIIEVDDFRHETERGQGGFGSTGGVVTG